MFLGDVNLLFTFFSLHKGICWTTFKLRIYIYIMQGFIRVVNFFSTLKSTFDTIRPTYFNLKQYHVLMIYVFIMFSFTSYIFYILYQVYHVITVYDYIFV